MRVKYDVRGVESGDRPVLPAGVHVGKITSADVTKPDGKDQRIELVVQVAKNGNQFNLYEYINLESQSARWKLRELLEAVGVTDKKKGESGTLDTDKMLVGKKLGVKTFIRPADDARGFDEQARIRRMFKADDVSADEEDLDADDSAEDLDDADDGTTEYDDMSLGELRKEARGRGIKTAGLKAEGIIERLVEDDEASSGEEPEAEADEEPDDGYEDMSIGELRKLARAAGIKTAGKKAGDIIEALREYDAEQEDEEPVEEEEPESEESEDEGDDDTTGEADVDDDYDEWSLEELRTELKDRSLATKGGKKVMIQRLRRDDAEGDEPF